MLTSSSNLHCLRQPGELVSTKHCSPMVPSPAHPMAETSTSMSVNVCKDAQAGVTGFTAPD